jgi:cation diffusion facilitator family transporter
MDEKVSQRKIGIARLSIVSNTLLILLKATVGIISGSVSIISEAIHSSMDLVAAIIAYFSVRISDTPPDEKHPYGHGKFENISGVVESLLIFIAAIWIIYEAVDKLLEPVQISKSSLGIGFAVMIIASLVNIIVSGKIYKVARETESLALEADALHLKTDVYTSLGVGIGLLTMWVAQVFITDPSLKTSVYILDPIVAILVALLIIKESYSLLKRAYNPLLDVTLPPEEIQSIELIINKYCEGGIRFHDLRTRKSGNYRFIDFHLEVSAKTYVGEAHHLCDLIENEIKSKFKNIEVTIHVETLEDN